MFLCHYSLVNENELLMKDYKGNTIFHQNVTFASEMAFLFSRVYAVKHIFMICRHKLYFFCQINLDNVVQIT